MSIRADYKSSKFGKDLITFQEHGQRAIDTLQGLRTSLPASKHSVWNVKRNALVTSKR